MSLGRVVGYHSIVRKSYEAFLGTRGTGSEMQHPEDPASCLKSLQ